MERHNTSRKRRRGRRKSRKVSPKAPPGGAVLPDVGADCSDTLEQQELPALHTACLYGELPTVRILVESRPWWINQGDSQSRRPLHMVLSSKCSPNTYACLKYLLEQGADVNATTDSGQTPLHLAVSEGLLDCSEILVKAGADILAKDGMGLTPLDMAQIWCQRKIARFLKHSLWHAEKKKEMEKIKLAQVLYRDLIREVKQSNLDKKGNYLNTISAQSENGKNRKAAKRPIVTLEEMQRFTTQPLTDEKIEEWTKTKGLPPLKEFAFRPQVSKYHNQCISADQTSCKPRATTGLSKGIQRNKVISTTQLEPSPNSPWTVFVGLQPEKRPTEPDLRDSVILWKDSSSQRLQYVTKWGRVPQPSPDLPLEVVERVLFPRAFPSRITTPRDFEPHNIEELQHRRIARGRRTSPWTEVAMHLAEFLELGHY